MSENYLFIKFTWILLIPYFSSIIYYIKILIPQFYFISSFFGLYQSTVSLCFVRGFIFTVLLSLWVQLVLKFSCLLKRDHCSVPWFENHVSHNIFCTPWREFRVHERNIFRGWNPRGFIYRLMSMWILLLHVKSLCTCILFVLVYVQIILTHTRVLLTIWRALNIRMLHNGLYFKFVKYLQ